MLRRRLFSRRSRRFSRFLRFLDLLDEVNASFRRLKARRLHSNVNHVRQHLRFFCG